MSDEVPFPPRRTLETLQQWVDEFTAQANTGGARIYVAPQEGEETRDTGLVVMHPANNPAMAVYMQAQGFDALQWEVTLPARDSEVPMSPTKLHNLATFVAAAGTLCAYLQYRSLEADRESGTR